MSAGGGLVDAAALPPGAAESARAFYSEIVPLITAQAAQQASVAVLFAPADDLRQDWRRAAVQDLARELAPVRINGVVAAAAERAEAEAVLAWLERAPGVTGRLLGVDGNCGDNR